MDEFTKAYIECALWSSIDDEDEALDTNYSVADLSPECLEKMICDCKDFQCSAYPYLTDLNREHAGHDFWLTRNGHGAGFWDDNGEHYTLEAGEKLTELCKDFCEQTLYVDRGILYVE